MHIVVWEKILGVSLSFYYVNVMITAVRPYLGVPLGSSAYKTDFLATKVKSWCEEVETLTRIAGICPHAAYAAYTHGFTSKWSYISDSARALQPLESAIKLKLLPALTGQSPLSDVERDLMAL